MSGDNSKESPKGSDESLERQLAGKAPDKTLEPVAAKEEQDAKTKLSEAANTTLPKLVAMEGILDTGVPTDAKEPNSSAAKAADPEPETKPIKTSDDMYERMFDSSLVQLDKKEETMSFKLKAEVWAKPEPEEPVKQGKKKVEPVLQEKIVVNSESPTADVNAASAASKMAVPEEKADASTVSSSETTILTYMGDAHVPANTKNKVALHITVSESQSMAQVLPDVEFAQEPIKQLAVKENAKPELLQATEPKLTEKQPIERKAENETIAKAGDTNKLPLSGKAVDSDGRTLGYWFDGGRKLVMSVSFDTIAQKEPGNTAVEKLRYPVQTDPVNRSESPASSNKLAHNETQIRTTKESFAPTTQPGPRVEQQKLVTRSTAPEPVGMSRQTNESYVTSIPVDKPAAVDYSSRLAQQKDVRESFQPRIASPEANRAVVNISKAIVPVQEHSDTSHPLGAALVQKASSVQRDVQDVVSTRGAKQVAAMSSLESSVKDYNKLVESNRATASIADKLKISTNDVNALKNAFDLVEPQAIAKTIEATKLSTTVEGLSALRDQAHTSLLKTIELIDQTKDQTLLTRLFQTAMILSLATNRDLAAINYTDISTLTLHRAIADSSDTVSYVSSSGTILKRMDFAPERDGLAISQDDAQVNAQTVGENGQVVRLDNAVNPVFAAVALSGGTAETYAAMAKQVEEREENQRLYQELPGWMKEKGFRIALSPGTPPPAESSKVIVSMPRVRGPIMIGDARIVSPTFTPLSTLGDRHTLTGQLQGLPRVLGGFDAVSLARYNAVLKRYPFLASDDQRRQSALFIKPDRGVAFQATATAQTVVVASATAQEPQAGPNAGQSGQSNQDEET